MTPDANERSIADRLSGWLPEPLDARMVAALLQPWLGTLVLVQAFSWWTYYQQAPIDAFNVSIYGLSVISSASFWFLLNLGRDVLGWIGRTLLAIIVALALGIVLVGSYRLYIEFGEFMSASMMQYAGKGGTSTMTRYIQEYLYYPVSVVFGCTAAGLTTLWALGPSIDVISDGRRTATGLVALGVFTLSLAGTSLLGDGYHQSPDTAMLTAATRSLAVPDEGRLGSPNRTAVPEIETNHPPPNVLLVVNESLGIHEFDLENRSVAGMPFLQSWLDRSENRTFLFRRAYANSTSTDISVPTLLTGVGPAEPTERLHTMPLVWDWARAAGLSPFYVSAQNYSSTEFPEFFFEGDSIPTVTPNSLEGYGDGDFAVDELLMAEKFGEMLDDVPDEKRFFAVYNSNAMHKPYQQTSPRLESQPRRGSPYRNGLFILDRALKRILEAVEREGRLEHTLVVMTSDHGEYSSRIHRMPRILSAYEEFARVPLMVRAPSSWPNRYPERLSALEENVERNVSNTDVTPTVVEALGFPRVGAAPQLRETFTGFSLLRPVPADRTIILLNNNAIRHWEHQGFGVFWRDWRFVYSDVEGPQLFDLSDDPRQQHDLWGGAPPDVREKLIQTIRDNRPLSKVWPAFDTASGSTRQSSR